jgi:hypothetical protein
MDVRLRSGPRARGALGVAGRKDLVILLFSPRMRADISAALVDTEENWNSLRDIPLRCASLHRQDRLGSTPRLCLAALRQRQNRRPRRLGTIHRNPVRLFPGLRLGRPCQLRRHLQSGVSIRWRLPAAFIRQSVRYRRRQRRRDRRLLLRLPHPLQGPNGAAMEPHGRAGPHP